MTTIKRRQLVLLLLCLAPALALLGGYALGVAAGAPAAASSPTVPAFVPMVVVPPTATPTVPPGAKPDLLVARMAISVEHTGCLEPGANLGVSVLVQNAGLAPAGAFSVTINGQSQPVSGGLAAGAFASVWSAGYNFNAENVAFADSDRQVAESNENNNRRAERLPIPTPPVACTPTPQR